MTDSLTDELLLARLGEAFGPDPDAAPTPASLAALHVAVAARQAARQPVRPRRQVRWWSRVRLAVAAVAGTTCLGAGVALAAGAPLPGPLRSIASGLGLPVDSPAVSATRHAEHALQKALHAAASTGPHTPADAAVARDATALSHRLAGLGPSDRSRLGATPNALLSQAHRLIPTVGTLPPATPPSTTVPSPSTTTVPTSVPTVPSVTVPPVTLPPVTLRNPTRSGSSLPAPVPTSVPVPPIG